MPRQIPAIACASIFLTSLCPFVGNAEEQQRDLRPIVMVSPVYPRKAASRRLEGWVAVEFTVTADGYVEDAVVIENCVRENSPTPIAECKDNPGKVFNRAALKAVEKFRYLSGPPVVGKRHVVNFELDG